jgi:hypothetical protein
MNGLLRMLLYCAVIVPFGAATPASAAVLDCVPGTATALTVRMGDAIPAREISALLIGGSAPALQLLDATTHAQLWSAGAQGVVVQRYADMTAGFRNAAAVDLDNDGVHDRIYAGDLAGRLWRFDLHHGRTAAQWTTGGIFADLSDTSNGRAFVAAPDISLTMSPGHGAWLNIAIGSASLIAGVSNRFYMLRERAVRGIWSQQQFDQWRPLRESDLVQIDVQRAQAAPTGNEDEATVSADGLFMDIGSGQVLTPSLTVSGRAVLAIADATPIAGNACAIPLSVAAMALLDGEPALDLNGDGNVNRLDQRFALPATHPATTAISLARDEAAGAAICMLADQAIPNCRVDTRQRRIWWRRADAD